MNSRPGALGARLLVVDTNILIRAALGRRVLSLLRNHALSARFLAPETAFAEARAYVPAILARRGLPAEIVSQLSDEFFGRLPALVVPVPDSSSAMWETEARQRLHSRDESDWPFVAMALTFGGPIWTEDQDFFGCGVATWTTDRVELYLTAR